MRLVAEVEGIEGWDVEMKPWPDNIVADRHEISRKWVLQYLTDEQAEKCLAALQPVRCDKTEDLFGCP